jgi:hypothetical protein
MGQCMAMGQAAGTAAALAATRRIDLRDLPFERLRSALRDAGAVLSPDLATAAP